MCFRGEELCQTWESELELIKNEEIENEWIKDKEMNDIDKVVVFVDKKTRFKDN